MDPLVCASRKGDKVIAFARNEERLDGLAQLGCQTALLDVASSAPDIRRVIDRVVAEFGRIDMLVNAAGYFLEGCGEETRRVHTSITASVLYEERRDILTTDLTVTPS
ncbi:MAG: hypothetical protein M1830_009927 [Pleopsidium flavum]|nr:MAG: hypothetical protein M1830_009927 [Pleopsidium flavum]